VPGRDMVMYMWEFWRQNALHSETVQSFLMSANGVPGGCTVNPDPVGIAYHPEKKTVSHGIASSLLHPRNVWPPWEA